MIELKRNITDNNGRSDSEDNLIDILHKKKDLYEHDNNLHKKHEKFFNKVTLGLGYPSFLFSLVISILSGSLSITTADNSHFILSMFILSLISSILQGTLNFFRLNERKLRHAFVSAQYSDLQKKLEIFLIRHHSKEDLEDELNKYLSNELILDEVKPNFSWFIKG